MYWVGGWVSHSMSVTTLAESDSRDTGWSLTCSRREGAEVSSNSLSSTAPAPIPCTMCCRSSWFSAVPSLPDATKLTRAVSFRCRPVARLVTSSPSARTVTCARWYLYCDEAGSHVAPSSAETRLRTESDTSSVTVGVTIRNWADALQTPPVAGHVPALVAVAVTAAFVEWEPPSASGRTAHLLLMRGTGAK